MKYTIIIYVDGQSRYSMSIAKSLDDNYETIIIDDEKQFNELYNS